MKKLAPHLLMLAVCLTFTACLKDSLNKNTNNTSNTNTNNTGNTRNTGNTSTNITGNWRIVNDSLVVGYWGIWAGKAPVGSNYIGKARDYYNFTTYGKLFMSEKAQLDTETYKFGSDTLHYRYAYIDGQTNQLDSTYNSAGIVSNLTDHTCTITSFAVSPETTYARIINLAK